MADDDPIVFSELKWIGQIVDFKDPPCSWEIVEKLQENSQWFSKWEFEECKFCSESSGVFVCKDTKTSIQAIMKIRIQIPFYEARNYPSDQRAKQAQGVISERTENEIEALGYLTSSKCPSIPKLIAWKHEIQDRDGCVPGGCVDYIVMEKLKGITLSDIPVYDMTPEQKQILRLAFKKAYKNCLKCGFAHLDPGHRNLIWDEENAQCYLIDWEIWRHRRRTRVDKWDESEYGFWGLD
ncbi:hypothetical protein BDV26DRAFT_295063 [Aspergillus bertholletiae]|uniref:Aminoglycoside phosphotransferase domain-containing protein n=1 Tax=Aspergillus bertholletiae TaxID=1226010 RepID=A0A5N7AZW9_9EURO|nr:hypothetical protein BDV26DRAFT_295063 [Aspergillus bertholletiae]